MVRSPKGIITAYAVFSVFFLLSFVHFGVGLRLRGFYTDMIVAWLWLGCTLGIIILFWKTIWAKVYLGFLGLVLIGSIMAMMIPFFMILFHFTGMSVKAHGDLGQDFRYEWKTAGALSHSRIFIYRPKFFVFEENVARPRYSDIVMEVKDIKFSSPEFQFNDDTPPSTIHLVQQNAQNLWIRFKIDQHEKTVTIPMYQDEGY